MSNVRTDSRAYDVISVGSGHHGLIAAAYLAKTGKRVLVLERQDYIGGGCVTKELTRRELDWARWRWFAPYNIDKRGVVRTALRVCGWPLGWPVI